MLSLKNQHFSDICRHLLCGWLVATLTEYLLLPSAMRDLFSLEGLGAMDFSRLCMITLGVAFFLWLLAQKWNFIKFERYTMVLCFGALTVFSLLASFRWSYGIFCLLVLTTLVVYALRGFDNKPRTYSPIQSGPWPVVTVGALAAVFCVLISLWTVSRVRTFSTPSYDFGIFSQMFYNMKESGLPLTTLERDGPLSHFAVHVSPVYYLLLPIYCLFPTPATLQILQAVVLASAVIPMWLIGKEKGLSPWVRVLMCLALLGLPSIGGGTSYDIHENCFLLPLILWLMYAIDKENLWLTGIFALLTLGVKEDAAVYVAVAGLYLTVRTLTTPHIRRAKNLFTGIGLVIVSLLYFLAVTNYLSRQGDGVMTYRYQNFMFEGSDSLFSVVKAVLLCPLKMLFECSDPEKIGYILQTMLPLLFLPLITRKFDRYLLLIPYLLLNLMSDYVYQHDVFFQYNFGSAAFLLYLTAINLADIPINWLKLTASATAAAVSVAFFSLLIMPKVIYYTDLSVQYSDYYEYLRQGLNQVPSDASVAATTFHTTYLSQRQTVYDIRYCSQEHLLSCEFVVIRYNSPEDYKRYTGYGDSGQDGIQNLLIANGYVPFYTDNAYFIIYRQAP